MISNHGGFTAETMTSLLITYQGSSSVVKLNMCLWIVLFVVCLLLRAVILKMTNTMHVIYYAASD